MYRKIILNDLGINEKDAAHVEYLENENEMLVFATLNPSQKICPFCGGKAILKEYKEETIKAKIREGKNEIVVLKKPRYRCKDCNKTYTHNVKNLATNRISNKTKGKIQKDFCSQISFKQIAMKYQIPLSTIIKIYDEMNVVNNAVIQEAICIDEFKNTKNALGKFACIIINFNDHKVIDILESRQLPYLRQYFSKIPLKIREFVKFIVTDMYDGYLTIAREFFPNAVVAIDPFHYIRYLTDAVIAIKIRLFKDENNKFTDLSWMSQHWRYLVMKREISNNIKVSISVFGEVTSAFDRTYKFVKQNDELLYAFVLLQDFYYDFKYLRFEKAESTINFYIQKMSESGIKELILVSKTRTHYKKEILNSFIFYKGKRLSNGPIEGINNLIKTIIKISYGLRDYQRLKKRIILIRNQGIIKG